MDQIEDVSPECIQIKGEQCIILRKKGDQEKDAKVVLTSSVSICFNSLVTSYTSMTDSLLDADSFCATLFFFSMQFNG